LCKRSIFQSVHNHSNVKLSITTAADYAQGNKSTTQHILGAIWKSGSLLIEVRNKCIISRNAKIVFPKKLIIFWKSIIFQLPVSNFVTVARTGVCLSFKDAVIDSVVFWT